MASAARVAGVRATLDSGSVASRHVPPGATTLRAGNDSLACTLTPEKIQLSEARTVNPDAETQANPVGIAFGVEGTDVHVIQSLPTDIELSQLLHARNKIRSLLCPSESHTRTGMRREAPFVGSDSLGGRRPYITHHEIHSRC